MLPVAEQHRQLMTEDQGVSSPNTTCFELAQKDFPLVAAEAVTRTHRHEIHGSPVAPLVLALGHAAPQVTAFPNVEVTNGQEKVDARCFWQTPKVRIRQDAVEMGKEGAGSALRRV